MPIGGRAGGGGEHDGLALRGEDGPHVVDQVERPDAAREGSRRSVSGSGLARSRSALAEGEGVELQVAEAGTGGHGDDDGHGRHGQGDGRPDPPEGTVIPGRRRRAVGDDQEEQGGRQVEDRSGDAVDAGAEKSGVTEQPEGGEEDDEGTTRPRPPRASCQFHKVAAKTAARPPPAARQRTTPDVAGTGVGWERMTVPASEKRWRRTRTVVEVGIPARVADPSRVQTATRATARTPATDGTGSGARRKRPRVVTRCPAMMQAAMGRRTWPAPGARVRRAVPRPAARATASRTTSGSRSPAVRRPVDGLTGPPRRRRVVGGRREEPSRRRHRW